MSDEKINGATPQPVSARIVDQTIDGLANMLCNAIFEQTGGLTLISKSVADEVQFRISLMHEENMKTAIANAQGQQPRLIIPGVKIKP